MDNVIALVKVLSKSMLSSFSMKKADDKSSSNTGNKLGLLFVVGLMLLCFIPLAISAYELSLGIGERGSNLIIQFLMLVMALLALFTGLLTNISILFLSRDNEQLLYLPLKPKEIFVARMIMSLFSTYFLIILFFMPSAIGVGLAQGFSLFYYLYVLLAIMLVPIIPVILSSTLLVVLVSMFKFLRNRNVVTYIILIFSFILGFGVSYFIELYMPELTSETDIFMLVSRYEEAINSLCQYLMFALPLIKLVDIKVIWWMKIVWIIVYIGLTTLVMIVAVWISSKLYLKGLLNINGNNKKKKYSKEKAEKEIYKKRSIFSELLSIEKKSLFRTPMAFLNLVLPVAIPIILVVGGLNVINDIDQITINSILPYIDEYYNQIILAISFVFSLTTMYSAVSYSKDGSNNFAFNYLPMSFMKVFMSKVFLGTLLNLIPFAVSLCAIYFVIDIDILMTIHGIISSLLAIFTINLIGVFIDINRPKLKWNSDTEAIKNNMNIFYYMILALVFYGVIIIFSDFAGLIELLVIIFIITMVKVNENYYRDKIC